MDCPTTVIQMPARDIPGLLLVNPAGGKMARAAAVNPLLEAGNVYLPHCHGQRSSSLPLQME
jgi:phage terminase large subunit-like protein